MEQATPYQVGQLITAPLSALIAAKEGNARKKKRSRERIRRMAASIHMHGGVLQNLVVVPEEHDGRQTIWQNLSFTSKLDKGSIGWTGKVCGSLVQLDERDERDERDGRLLDNLLSEQSVERKRYELDEHAQKQITTAHCQSVRHGSLRFGS